MESMISGTRETSAIKGDDIICCLFGNMREESRFSGNSDRVLNIASLNGKVSVEQVENRIDRGWVAFQQPVQLLDERRESRRTVAVRSILRLRVVSARRLRSQTRSLISAILCACDNRKRQRNVPNQQRLR